MSLGQFFVPTTEMAIADALGLVMRQPVADGTISDDELLRIAPVMQGRKWASGLDVGMGDVYGFQDALWRCVQAHTT